MGNRSERTILIKGYYGFENVGDDVFCLVSNKYLNTNHSDIKTIYIGSNIPNAVNSIKINSNYLRRFIELYYMLKVNKIIFFGGSLFHSKIKIGDFRYLMSLNKKIMKKTSAFGISVGPFKDSIAKEGNLKFLENIGPVFVRDTRSTKYFKNIKYSFDAALLISELFPELLRINKTDVLGINIGSFNTTSKSMDKITSFIEENNIKNIKLFIFNNDDKKLVEVFFRNLKNQNVKIIEYNNDTYSILSEMAKCSFMIGERLHFGIISFSLGIPFLQIEYHQKCTDFLDEIKFPNQYRDNWNLAYLEKGILNNILNQEKCLKLEVLKSSLKELDKFIDE